MPPQVMQDIADRDSFEQSARYERKKWCALSARDVVTLERTGYGRGFRRRGLVSRRVMTRVVWYRNRLRNVTQTALDWHIVEVLMLFVTS